MSTLPHKNRSDWWPLLLCMLYLLAVVLPLLGRYGLWFDEIFSVVMSRSIDSIMHMVRTQENNMLLHYFFLWLWQPLGNGSEFFLRSSSVLLVLLSLIPLHVATRRLSGIAAANTAIFLYASHFLLLEHVRACRGYSLALLMSALVLWRWVVAWQTRNRCDWCIAGAIAGLAVWSHYFAALVLPVLLFAMWWRDGVKQPWRELFYAMVMFVLCALPIVLTRPPDGAAQIGWADVPDWRTIRGTLWMLAGSNGLHEQPLLAVMFAVCAVASFVQWRSYLMQRRHVVVGLAAGLLLTVLAVLAESFVGQPLFVYRFFTPLVPLYCSVFATVLCCLWPWLRVLLVSVLLLVSAYETWKPYVTEPVPVRYWWKPMTQQLVQQMHADDIVLVYPAFLHLPVDYYLDVIDAAHHLPRTQEYVSAPYRAGGGMESAPDWQHVQWLSDGAARIWLIADEKPIASWQRLQRTQAPAIRTLLLRGRTLVFEQHYNTMTVQRYDRVTPPLPANAP